MPTVAIVKAWRDKQDPSRCRACWNVTKPEDFTIRAGKKTKRCISCAKSSATKFRQRQQKLGKPPRHVPTEEERQESKWRQENKVARRFGITYIYYKELSVKLNNCCPICMRQVKRLVLDHCHKTDKFRGLICCTCNSGIGMLKEDPKIFIEALKYLEYSQKNPNTPYGTASQTFGFQ